MAETPTLKLYNTLTREKEAFVPIDANNVRMYVCGPTVYDYAHIGNARPAIVFDVLYRLLRHLYGEDHVTYVRNITDVDDKINARALRDYPDMDLNAAIRLVTEKTYDQYQKDVKALGCLPPTVQPRATEHIAKMVEINQSLIDKGHAYVATGAEGREVLFSTGSMAEYGQLSKRRLDEQQAGARIAVEAHKKNPADFVLWKESAADQPGWQASYKVGGDTVSIYGRPGWHIECSAMSAVHLGETFDIHGGGLDLIFPHHENEIAQSRCAFGHDVMANVWMHNGFLQVEGRKMSKSEGNFVTIHELLETEKFGGRKWPGEVLRLAMLMTHYREPIDFSVKRLENAESVLEKLRQFSAQRIRRKLNYNVWSNFEQQLTHDLNTPMAISLLVQEADKTGTDSQYTVFKALKLLGFDSKRTRVGSIADKLRVALGSLRALSSNEFREILNSADRAPFFLSGEIKPETEILDIVAIFSQIRKQFEPDFIAWEKNSAELRIGQFKFTDSDADRRIALLVDQRLRLLTMKNFAEADKIRDELLAKGIQLRDGKDPATGERVTTWEVKR